MPNGGALQRRGKLLMLIALAAVLPHLGHLGDYFWLDDFWHIRHLDEGGHILQTWTMSDADVSASWVYDKVVVLDPHSHLTKRWYFRPLASALLWLELKSFGYEGTGVFAMGLLWHLTASLLLFALARRVFERAGDRRATSLAFLGALIFAVHPASAEPHFWACAQGDIQALILAMSASLAYLRYCREGRLLYLGLAGAAMTLGLLCKESLVVWPLTWLVYEGARRFLSAHEDHSPVRPLWPLAALFLLGWLYLALSAASPDSAPSWSVKEANLLGFFLYGPWAVIGFNALAYADLFLVGRNVITYLDFPAPLPGVFGHLGLALALLAAWGLWRRRNSVWLWVGCWGVCSAAVIAWMPPGSRYLYGSLPALALVCAGLFMRAWAWRRPWLGKAARAAVVGLLGFWVMTSVAIGLGMGAQGAAIKTAIKDIREEVRAHPEARDLYLLNVWPGLSTFDTALSVLSGRRDLRFHVLSAQSSGYNPGIAAWKADIVSWYYRLPSMASSSLDLEVSAPSPQTLELHSSPIGYLPGPAASNAVPDAQRLKPFSTFYADGMWIRLGDLAPGGGFASMRFTFSEPIAEADTLWLVYEQGHMRHLKLAELSVASKGSP